MFDVFVWVFCWDFTVIANYLSLRGTLLHACHILKQTLGDDAPYGV